MLETKQIDKVYSSNITLREIVKRGEGRTLENNEYYALMVTDLPRRSGFNAFDNPFDGRVFFDNEKGWVGLEQTSKPSEIYISKDLHERLNLCRGITFIVKVLNASVCCELTNY